MLSEEIREYLFRVSEVVPITMPEVGWPDEVALLESDNDALKERVEGFLEVALAYKKHIDDDCGASGCLCDLMKHPCSEWIDKVLQQEPQDD